MVEGAQTFHRSRDSKVEETCSQTSYLVTWHIQPQSNLIFNFSKVEPEKTESRTPIVFNEEATTVGRDLGAGPFDRFDDQQPVRKVKKSPNPSKLKTTTNPSEEKTTEAAVSRKSSSKISGWSCIYI